MTVVPAGIHRTWLKNPLAILADGAGGGVVIDGSRISELVPEGGTPTAEVAAWSTSGAVHRPKRMFGVGAHDESGIWGGTSQKERRLLGKIVSMGAA